MANIYLYPKFNSDSYKSRNPYMKNLEISLAKQFHIVNSENNKIGVLDLFRHLFRSDVYYFNWIEDLPSLRFGKMQIIFFALFLIGAKRLKKKIIWTLHNKYSHRIKRNYWTDFMYKSLVKNSDLIITHSESGIEYVQANYPRYVSKVKYIIHPVEALIPKTTTREYKFDFLIWGIIYPYKGIVEFLEFVHRSGNSKTYKILLVGKCLDNDYKGRINQYLSDNIVYHDRFYELEDIASFANQSKFTLFTYKSESVLSSGALMDSLRMGSVIIGPDIGAFKDLSSFDFVKTYHSFEDILSIYNDNSSSEKFSNGDIARFCFENSWEKFGDRIVKQLNRIKQEIRT